LSRFARLDLIDRTFKVPSDFSLDGYLGNAWRMIKGDRDYKVVLDFEATIAETIAETQWHKTQETEFLKGGKVRLTFTVSGLDEIVWWVLSMGGSCTVLEPAELADRVMKHATELSNKYKRGAAT
jgi:predicted DNA-binding transcriptional regulator YafY